MVKQSVEELGYIFKGEALNASRGSDVWFS
jgi:hypothetical protein